MKVRAKTPCIGPNYEVVEETTRFYITLEDGLSHYLALPKDDYEPVEEWVDVTGIYNGDEAMGVLHSSLYKLTRHEVSKLNTQMKAYAYLLEREKA